MDLSFRRDGGKGKRRRARTKDSTWLWIRQAKAREQSGMGDSSPTLPIPLLLFSTSDPIYPQAVKKGQRHVRLRRGTDGGRSQAVGKGGAAA
jgi:hypothetical protein